ncbi:MAG: hypothetical protein IKE73_03925 [Bacilli bacterium]|nr:hypothetical protein [Bacilli bacterium]
MLYLAIAAVILIISFVLSYKKYKNETYKTKKERVKSMQLFILSWTLIVFVAIALYLILCSYFGEKFFFSI